MSITALVAITKCDLGDPARIAAEVREQLRGTSLGEIPIVQTSVRAGTGLEELKQTLTRVCAAIPKRGESGKARLFVDRVFTVHGTGTVVTGTLAGGPVARGETISLQPQNLRARVRALESHNQSLEVALPGMRTALNLPDLRPDEIPRGSVLTSIDSAKASCTIDALLERSSRAFPILASAQKRFRRPSALRECAFYGPNSFCSTGLSWSPAIRRSRACVSRSRHSFSSAIVASSAIRRDGRRSPAASCWIPMRRRTVFRSPVERRFLQARAAQPNDLFTLIDTQLQRDRVIRRAGCPSTIEFQPGRNSKRRRSVGAREEGVHQRDDCGRFRLVGEAAAARDRGDRRGTCCASRACRP